MAAPTPTPRQVPTGVRPGDGHKTLIVFANIPDLAVWEEEVSPCGGKINTFEIAHMHLNEWAQMGLGSLKRMNEIKFSGLYDADAYDDIMGQLGVEQAISTYWPTGSSLAVWGALTEFSPKANKEGDRQAADFTVTVTNADPSDGSEAGPVHALASGTGT